MMKASAVFAMLHTYGAMMMTMMTTTTAFSLSPSSMVSSLNINMMKGQRRSSACIRTSENTNWALQSSKDNSNNSNNEDGNAGESDLSWMREAMGLSKEEQEKALSPDNGTDYSMPLTPLLLQQGIAGFAVDEKLGFVCVIVGDVKDGTNNQPFTHATISPTDVDTLSSPEALCLVQLSGGLDLGAAVFPPETLAKIVYDSMVEGENESGVESELPTVEELRWRVTLLAVTAEKNEDYIHSLSDTDADADADAAKSESKEEESASSSSSPERDAAIEENAPKILMAVKNLPGLATVTIDQIKTALIHHADEMGNLNDRTAFSNLLDSLRRGTATTISTQDEKVSFKLTVSISSSSSSSSTTTGNLNGKEATVDSFTPELKLMDVENVPAFQAVALSLRYKVKIGVSGDCFDYEYEEEEEQGSSSLSTRSNGQSVLDRFPAFKPMQELVDDAKGMDGFISSMFFKQSAPDNDDKM